MQPESDSGMVSVLSTHTVDETVSRVTSMLQQRNIKLFALIDHSGEAASVGLKMPPTKLLIFGNPKAGTPLMLAAPTAAIDLPLKILVWEDARGQVWVSYNQPEYLQRRHQFPAELIANIAAAGTLASAAAQ